MQNIILNKFNIYSERKMCKRRLEKLRCLRKCHSRKRTILHMALKYYKPMPTLSEDEEEEEKENTMECKCDEEKKVFYNNNKIKPTNNDNIKIIIDGDENINEKQSNIKFNKKNNNNIKPFFHKINVKSGKIMNVFTSVFFMTSCRGSTSIRIYQ
uniref:Uncharacterized protein n=1 Tax=Parastrongyloides trichosuri TaxID=131310 RepID=A0A0N4ZJ21_PARTI